MEVPSLLHNDWSTNESEVSCVSITRENNLLTGHESCIMIWLLKIGSKEVLKNERMKTPIEGCVTCICQFPRSTKLALSINQTILTYQYNVVSSMITSLLLEDQFSFNKEEINQIDIHPKGSYMCSCDDSGEIKVINITQKELLCTLSRFHGNICSTVKFSARKHWELFSGGLDSSIGQWDFSRGRLIAQVSTISQSKDMLMINPPMVHSLDMFPTQHFIACGLGDGRLVVYSFESPKRLDLICQIQPHSASVACVRCIDKDNKLEGTFSSFLVSAGNDGVICIHKLNCGTDHSMSHELLLVRKIDGIPKVNWIDVVYCDPAIVIFTANVTGTISVYS